MKATGSLGGKGLIYKCCELRFAQRADFGGGELAFVEDHEGGDAANAEFAGDVAVFIDVEFGDLQFAVVGRGQFVERWRNRFARAAPLGPEVNEHGLVGLQHVGFERCVRDVFDEVAGHDELSFVVMWIGMLADVAAFALAAITVEAL